MSKLHKFTLCVDANSEEEADAIVQNLLSGKTLGHEVGAFAWQRGFSMDVPDLGRPMVYPDRSPYRPL